MQSITNGVFLVTGAARGLGLEICRQLLEAGGRVAGWDVRGELLQEAAGRLDDTRFWPLPVDLTDEAAIIGAVAGTLKRWGRIDGLVNNAGIRIVAPVWDMSEPDWNHVHAVNLKAQFLLAREVLKQAMLASDRGKLIFISSLAGVRGVPRGAAYASSKFGIRGLAASIAQDLKQTSIRVSCLLPGMLLTPMARESEVWDLGLEWLDPAAVARIVLLCLQQDPDTALPEIIVHNRAQI